MTNLLKAMGFWIWALLAVVLSVSVVTVSYRMTALTRSLAIHDSAVSTPAAEPAHSVGRPQSKGPMVSRVIAKEMSAAQTAMQSEDWNTAIKSLDAAAAKHPLTAFDTKTIADFHAFIYMKLRRFNDARTAYQAGIATGLYSREERLKVDRALFFIAASSRDYAQTIALGTQLADGDNASVNDLSMVAQSYFQLKDCNKASMWSDKAIAAAVKSGAAPKENLYLFKLQCASDAGSSSAMSAVLYDLIRLTHKPWHWNTLLRIERQGLHADHNTLQVDRLMYDTGAMTADTDFVELAQLLGDQGSPGEGVMVLKSLMASSQLKSEHRDRTERLLAVMAHLVETAPDNLDPDAVRSLLLANAGEDGARTFGAPSPIERTATRSQLEQPEELNLYIARVLITQGDFAGARTALQKFIRLANPSVAKVWQLYADTLPEPAPAAAPANPT